MKLKNRLRIGVMAAVIASVGLSACSLVTRSEAGRAMDAGKKLLAKKDYARAILEFKNAIRAKPDSAEAYYQLGLAYLAAGDWNMAAAHLTRATELDPRHRDAQLKVAELMATTEDRAMLGEAKKRLEEQLAATPNDVETLISLAVAEWKLASPEAAEAHLRRAFSSDPGRLDSALALAKAQIERRDFAAAEQVLKTAANRQPPSAGAMVALGEFYFTVGRLAEAELQFRRALAVDSANGAALFDLAAMNVRSGNLGGAESIYGRLSSLPDPDYRALHATFLLQIGKLDSGVSELQALARKYPEDRRVRSALVAGLLAMKKIAEAEQLLDGELRRNSKDVEALLQRSSLRLAERKYNDAERDLNLLLRYRPDAAEAHYLLAKIHQGRGAVLSQRQQYTEALAMRPDFIAARLELAALLTSANGAMSALGVLDEAPAEQKKLPALIAQRDWALIAIGRDAEARSEVSTALASGLKGEFLLLDAALKANQGRFDDARKSAQEFLVSTPGDVRAMQLVVQTYAAQNQAAAAVKEIQGYARAQKDSAPVQLFLGRLLLEAGDGAGARSAFLAAKTADPGLVIADLSLVQSDIQAGRLNEARQALTDLIQANGEHLVARLWLGHLEEMAGNHKSAIEHYRMVLDVDANNVNALNNLSYLLAEYNQQYDEALKFAQRAAELSPQSAATENTLGWVLYREGIFAAAVKHLETAMALEPTARRAAHLAMAYARLGDQRRGRESLRAALRMDPNLPEVRQANQMLDAQGASR